MSFLHTVRRTLDPLYAEVTGVHSDKADARIKKAFKALSDSYFAIGKPNRVRPDYTDPATRFAYGFKYVGGHAYVLRRLLQKLRSPAFLSRDVLRVACIGGGPGSDLIGVMDFVSIAEPDSALETVAFSIFDKEPGWRRNLQIIEAEVQFEIDIETAFHDFDATRTPGKTLKRALAQADLVTISFLVSELLDLDCDAFWGAVFEEIPAGCLVVICDIGSDGLQAFLAQLAARPDIDRLVDGQGTFQAPGHGSMLNPHYSRLDHHPKMRSDTTYAVFEKR